MKVWVVKETAFGETAVSAFSSEEKAYKYAAECTRKNDRVSCEVEGCEVDEMVKV